MQNLWLVLLCGAASSTLKKKEPEEIATDVIVPHAEWESYDNCESKPCVRKCTNVQGFHVVMCASYMCKECVSDWCVQACQDAQKQYPACRCPTWPASRLTYSQSGGTAAAKGEEVSGAGAAEGAAAGEGAADEAAEATTVAPTTTTTSTTTVDQSELIPGHTVALHFGEFNYFLRMSDTTMDGTEKDVDKLPDDWHWEHFLVVDGGNGEVALWSKVHGRFMRMEDTNIQRGPIHWKDLPSDYDWERFVPVTAPGGTLALYNPTHKKFFMLNQGGAVQCSAVADTADLPDDWQWERFKVVDFGVVEDPPLLVPGTVVGLHNSASNRFIRMNDNRVMDCQPDQGDVLKPEWTYERFHVVDAGQGCVALWNEYHGRYVRAYNGEGKISPDASDKFGKNDVQDDWHSEMFTPWDAGNGEIALYNRWSSTFIGVYDETTAGMSPEHNEPELPSDWTSERFTVVDG